MKIKVLILLSLLLLPFCIKAQNYNFKYNPGEFTELKVIGKIDVVLLKSMTNELQYSVEGIGKDDLIFDNKNGELVIKVKFTAGIAKNYKVKMKILYKNISELFAGASAVINIKERLSGSSLNVEAGNDAEIYLDDLQTTKAELKSSAGGTIQVTGMVRGLDAKANSGGTVYALDLISDDVKVRADAGGLVEVAAIKSIEAKATTGGKVVYSRNPKDVKTSTSFGGKIETK
ncbi:MAG: GIN domain-containing protein [Bacteroidales bacterium]